MLKKFFIAGDKLLALNAKVGTSTFARAIIRRHHPEIDREITEAYEYPEGVNADNRQWQHIVPFRHTPDRPVVLTLRDPIERFRSAMAQVRLDDVDAAIAELNSEAGAYGFRRGVKLVANVHFLPQKIRDVDLNGQELHVFRFPEQLDEVVTFLDLVAPLVTINEGNGVKPDLTESQIAAVREFYAEDQALWESLQITA